MVEAAEVPVAAVAAMRAEPSWPSLEMVAHALAYEAAVMGPGNASRAVAGMVPGARHRVLEGQAHNVSAKAFVPELLEFFTTT